MIPMPTVAEERAIALHRPVSWRRFSIVAQVVLFILTAVGIAALFWLADLLGFPKGWVTAIVSIVIAEVLIDQAHFWRTGVESALWLGGLFAFIFGLPSSGKPEAILVFAAAAAIAGWRVRNALFGTLAMVLIVAYLAVKEEPWLAACFGLAASLLALAAETRLWQRPSTELLWQAALVAMPIAAYVPISRETKAEIGVVALFTALAILFGAFGMKLRLRIVLLASAIALAIAAVAARGRIPISDEAYLIACGVIVLAIAAVLMRKLRGGEAGFVLSDEQHELDDALQVAAMLPLAAPTATPALPAPAGGGGEFGGAGASGKF